MRKIVVKIDNNVSEADKVVQLAVDYQDLNRAVKAAAAGQKSWIERMGATFTSCSGLSVALGG